MMCAKLLRHKPASEHGPLLPGLRARLRGGHRVLRPDAASGCCGTRRRRSLVAVATLVADDPPLRRHPEGLLPGAGHGRDPRHLGGVADRSRSPAMAERQQALAREILKDPAVESLSSFIGIDGTNTTINSGRIQINLKPLEERRVERRRRHPPPAARAREGRGHHALHAAGPGPDGRGPRQPDAVPVQPRGRRTRGSSRRGCRASWSGCRRCRSCATSRATSRTRGSRRGSSSTATTASRLGITPQMLDDTLYDAFGQRQVSTMFTQLNQYRVVLEAEPRVPAAPRRPDARLPAVGRAAARCRSAPSPGSRRSTRRSPSTTRGSSRSSPSPSTSRRAPRSGEAVARDREGRAGARPAAEHPDELPGHGAGVPGLAREHSRSSSSRRSSRSTSCSACSTRATSTRSRSSRRCRRRASARCSR